MYPKIPTVIEGIPVITSAVNRRAAATRPSDSARKSPTVNPSGTATATAMAVITTVPTMAFHTPPPATPSGVVEWVKKSRFQAGRPLATT